MELIEQVGDDGGEIESEGDPDAIEAAECDANERADQGASGPQAGCDFRLDEWVGSQSFMSASSAACCEAGVLVLASCASFLGLCGKGAIGRPAASRAECVGVFQRDRTSRTTRHAGMIPSGSRPHTADQSCVSRRPIGGSAHALRCGGPSLVRRRGGAGSGLCIDVCVAIVARGNPCFVACSLLFFVASGFGAGGVVLIGTGGDGVVWEIRVLVSGSDQVCALG